MLFSWFTLAGTILLFAPTEWTNNFQFAFLRVFNWPLRIGEGITLSVRSRSRVADADAVPRKKYRELLNYCSNLEARLEQQQDKIEKFTGLRDRYLLGNASLVDALVYPTPTDKYHGEIRISKGKDSRLLRGQFVLAENSIIGTVSEVSTGGASVILFTNPASNIAVKVAGTKRYMVGTGENMAKIPMMTHKPKIGEAVFTAEKAGFLNAPVVIGKVARCERNRESPVLWDIIVEPACDTKQLNDVIVIVMNPIE